MIRISIMVTALSVCFSGAAFAELPGKVLHDEANCMKCHKNLGYNTDKTVRMSIGNKAQLNKAVNFCNNNLNIGWFDDEVGEVADYLNQEYYKLTD